MKRRLAICLLLALAASMAHAQVPLKWPATTRGEQSRPEQPTTSTLLPVLNREPGRLAAFWLVEPEAMQPATGLYPLPNTLSTSIISGSRTLGSARMHPARIRAHRPTETAPDTPSLYEGPASP